MDKVLISGARPGGGGGARAFQRNTQNTRGMSPRQRRAYYGLGEFSVQNTGRRRAMSRGEALRVAPGRARTGRGA